MPTAIYLAVVLVIANADMYFDHTLRRLEGYDLSGKLLCLSRWDVQSDGTLCFFDHPCSQDAWIFRAPISEFFCDFHLGVLGFRRTVQPRLCLPFRNDAWQSRAS
jgi:hypothetical protein